MNLIFRQPQIESLNSPPSSLHTSSYPPSQTQSQPPLDISSLEPSVKSIPSSSSTPFLRSAIFNQVYPFSTFFLNFFSFFLLFLNFLKFYFNFYLFFWGLDVGEKWLVELMRSSHHEMHIDNGLLEIVRFLIRANINFST